MSFPIQKYVFLKRKKKRSFLSRNVWYSQKLQSKQRKKIFVSKKTFLNEIGRKMVFFRLKKTVFPFSEIHGSFFSNISAKIERKNSSFQTLENQKKSGTNRLWFFQTAAPIPGVSFLKKFQKFQTENVCRFRIFQTFFPSFQKKQRIQRVLNISENHKKRNVPKNWAFLVLRNSLKTRTFRQAIFVKNSQTRPEFEKFCFLNGKKRKKKNFRRIRSEKALQKPGDFSSFSRSVNVFPFFLNQMYSKKP